jgi:signal transduction histidine kinase
MKLEFLSYLAMVALSLFNTIVLFWLGFTVWLNAEKRGRKFRRGGIWLATAGLLLGGVFFATHTAMLDFTLDALVTGMRSWWYFFFAPIVLLPHAWYLLMLWYAGFWDDKSSALHRRHRLGLAATTILVIVLIALLFFANPFPLAERSTYGIVHTGARLFPLVALLYPVYILGCIAFSLDALHRPAKSGRMMGDIARRRARPWLLAASFIQLLVSLLVGAALGWLLAWIKPWELGRILNDGSNWIDRFDLLLTLLLAVTIVLAGKAMVSYEIFTGKVLPRRGFLRQWRGVVTVAGLSSVLLAWCISVNLRPVYALLLVVVGATAIFALLSWRFFHEREEMMQQLRPFTASQHLYERVLGASHSAGATPPALSLASAGAPPGRAEALVTFAALCEVLETSGARLIPFGTLAPFVAAPLCYPNETRAPQTSEELAAREFSPHEMAVAIAVDNHEHSAPNEYSQRAAWAIPLWSGRGRIGVLLLGDKKRGALYSEEEIALAQAGSERLLDALAGATLASHLMELQRRRLNEAQLADGQSTLRLRRALHDEILPRLHAALLMMGGDEAAHHEAQLQLSDAHREISGLLHSMPSALPSALVQNGLFGMLRRTLEEEFAGRFDNVVWHVATEAEELATQLSPLVAETLFHAAREAIRNAARHARGHESDAPLQLSLVATATPANLEISIEDDGVGPGREYSTVAHSDGHGLALHSTMMAVIGGALAVESVHPHGTRVRLTLNHQ